MEYNMVFRRPAPLIVVKLVPILLFVFLFLGIEHNYAQNTKDSSESLTLKQCIDYALKHQPALNQSYINQAIVKTSNAINLSGWLPQVNLNAELTHYFQLPTAFIPNSTPGGPPT